MAKDNSAAIKKSIEKFTSELKTIKTLQAQLQKLLVAYNKQQALLTKTITASEKLLDDHLSSASENSTSDLISATKQMQEMQMSFNLQYLQLQSQMQHENRSYTAISNIMKTKHDTVKNSIGNIR